MTARTLVMTKSLPYLDAGSDILANYTLNFYCRRLDEIVGKIHRALKPGGGFMVTFGTLIDKKTTPMEMIVARKGEGGR